MSVNENTMSVSLVGLFIFVLIQLSAQNEILTPEKDICRLFADGNKLRKPGSCSEGIICENLKSKSLIVCSDKFSIYSKDSSKCVEKTSDSYCKSPCSKNSPVFVSDPKNCNNWYKCNGATTLDFSNCPEDMLFEQSTQSCLYPDQTTCVANYNFCDVTPNDKVFRDEDNCHKYYVCVKGKLTVKTCDLGTYFDVTMGICIAKAQVDCYKHPYPENVCGTTKLAKRDQFVSDEATCRGYFYCKDLGSGNPDPNPLWAQCPFSSFFDEKHQLCATRADMKCNEDRCDGRIVGKEISETKGCQYYLNCKDNYTLSEEYCGDGLYFDADQEKCTNVKHQYGACT